MRRKASLSILVIAAGVMVAACGGGGGGAGGWGGVGSGGGGDAAPDLVIAKAQCGEGDRPETGLQGAVPMAARAGGFKGFSCNLEQASAVDVQGGMWRQFVLARDRSGRLCGYAAGAYWTQGEDGTAVVDLSDPNKAIKTTVIKTPGLMRPGEGLRAHTGRGLLIGAYYMTVANYQPPEDMHHGFDVYDISTDCRYPQMLASTTALTFPTDGMVDPEGIWKQTEGIYGHEGAISLDGMTFYVTDSPHRAVHAIDLADPTKPQVLASYQTPTMKKEVGDFGPHGLGVSDDGKRVYMTNMGNSFEIPSDAVPATGEWNNGFITIDTAEVQDRVASAKMKTVSKTAWRDGQAAQMAIPFKVKGKSYLIATDEGGSGTIEAACAQKLTPFAMARIFDMADEQAPKEIKKIQLEVNDPKHCGEFMPEMTFSAGFTYDIHMCSVDNRDEATAMACGYFWSGIRVYDIRDPHNVKEIAYFVPGTASTGAEVGWCGALPMLDAQTGMVYSHCADTGVLALRFKNGTWPFPESKTPTDKQL